MDTSDTLKLACERPSLLFTLGAAALALGGGCSGAPAGQHGPQAAASPAGGATNAAGTGGQKPGAGEPAQFDNGSYDVKKANGDVVGTAFVLETGAPYRELWVLSTASGNVTCGASHCDISGLPITKRSGGSDCAAWRAHAATLTEPRVVGVTYETDVLPCGGGPANCRYEPQTPSHTFSLFPAGRYTQCGSQSPRVFVETAGDSVREYWAMTRNIGLGGATLSTVPKGPESLSAFLCGACVDENMNVVKVKYEHRDSVDCRDVGL